MKRIYVMTGHQSQNPRSKIAHHCEGVLPDVKCLIPSFDTDIRAFSSLVVQNLCNLMFLME